MSRFVSIVHDMAAAFLMAGVATSSAAALILFDRAPSREVAGQIGQTIFEVVGRGTFAMALVLLACRLAIGRQEPRRASGTVALALVVVMVVASGLIALWITPALGEIWRNGEHAADGSGLVGADRAAFGSRHGMGSAAYLVILVCAAVTIGLRATGRA